MPMPAVLQVLDFLNPQASRLFIDMIWDVTSKWANWDPGHTIKVGDFGTPNRSTGELEVKGNIYDPTTNKKIFQDDSDTIIRDQVARHPVIVGAREEKYFAVSLNGRQTDLKAEQHNSVSGFAEASIKGRWSFTSRRGALLIMSQPQSSYIPHNVFLEDLAKVAALKDMYLVTQVFSCPAFSLYLSNSKGDDVSVALLGSAPVPHVPGATVGGKAQAKWWSSTTAGLFRDGLEPEGKDQYAPLYTLKKIRIKPRSRRGIPDPVFTGDEVWADAEPPWDLLDEDGKEESSDSGEDEDS